MILLASASTLIFNPCFNVYSGIPLGRSTTGMLARAQPEAVVMSALEHTTALGAFPYSFSEYIAYAPTLLPMAYGRMSTDPLSDLLCSSCSGSVIVPVYAL